MSDILFWAALVVVGYVANAFVVFAFGEIEKPLKTMLGLASIIPFGAAAVMIVTMLLIIAALIVVSIPVCIIGGGIKLVEAMCYGVRGVVALVKKVRKATSKNVKEKR